jgi:SAM-dependent methyltransferase
MDASFIEPYREKYPRAAQVAGELVAKVPTILGGQVLYQHTRHGEEFWREAERLLALSETLGGPPTRTLVDFTGSYLKSQAQYLATGKYAQSDFDTAYREVYGNPKVMEGSYLKGLLLSHAFWPIHFDIHRIFSRAFVPRIPASCAAMEIGFGHGLYLLEVLQSLPGVTAKGFDVSPSSVAFATKVMGLAGVDPGRHALTLHDVRNPLPLPADAIGAAIFAEVLEHIPAPEKALVEVLRVLEPGAPAFLTTVLYSNHMDHMTQFADQAEVDRMITGAGFEIAEVHALKVSDYVQGTQDPTVDLVYVCQKPNRLAT